MGAATRFVLNPLAALVRLLGWLLGLLMVLYLLFASLGANPANPWARFVESWAPRLDLGLGHLSVLPDPRIELWVSYGIAAVLWVLIGVIVGRVIGRIGARQRTASHTGGGDLP